MSAINLVQVTDTHLFAQPKSKLHKINTLDSLNEVLDCIKRNENQIDCIVATGDIAQDASFDAYKYFMLSIEKLSILTSNITELFLDVKDNISNLV